MNQYYFRSFGDFLLKSEMDKPPWKQVISPVPQIEQFKIDPSWEFLIVATDGVIGAYMKCLGSRVSINNLI